MNNKKESKKCYIPPVLRERKTFFLDVNTRETLAAIFLFGGPPAFCHAFSRGHKQSERMLSDQTKKLHMSGSGLAK